MTLLEYTLLATSSLFVIVDPVATVPAFLAMTHDDAPEKRIKMARLACGVMTALLLAFAVVGQAIFRFLGITLPAFQMAGSIVLLLIALDMLKAQRSRVQETPEETDAGAAKEDIAVTPLAVPMLAGPGAISTVFLLRAKVDDPAKFLALVFAILFVAGLAYVILVLSAHGARWLSPIALRLSTRIMGLLLAGIAVQFMLNALKDLNVLAF